jgi:diguanylate cyclase (GGDEF)-like protein
MVGEHDESRRVIGRHLRQQAETVVKDAISLLPFAGEGAPDDELCDLLVRTLIASIEGGGVDPRGAPVSLLRRFVRERRVSIPQLFRLVYLVERAALDKLAADESFGAASEPWPSIVQIVRRSSIDVLAGFATRLSEETGENALVDPLTTLHTRAVLLAVLDKELKRSERSGYPFALILFDIDRLSAINEQHGYGFGDRVIERIGIVLRNYFREQDWVARCESDSFAVLLPETLGEPAMQLAERARETVQERMALRDYRTDKQVTVTVSVGVVVAGRADGSLRAERLLREAEQAAWRAKQAGRNRVERVELNVGAPQKPTAPPGTAP